MLPEMAQRLYRPEFQARAADQARTRRALDPRIVSDGSIEPDPPGIKRNPDEVRGGRP